MILKTGWTLRCPLRGTSSLPRSSSWPAPALAPSGRGGPGGGASRPRVAWGPISITSSEPTGWASEGGRKTGLMPEPPAIPFSASAALGSLSEARGPLVLGMVAPRLCRRCLPELTLACLVESLPAGGCRGAGPGPGGPAPLPQSRPPLFLRTAPSPR